jgi:hypothetical protein
MTTSVSPSVIQPGIHLPASITTVASCAAGTQIVIQRAVFSNATNNSVSITVFRVAASGVAGAQNVIIPLRQIFNGTTDLAPELANMALNPGETIQVLAGAGQAINCFISGLVAS